MRQIPVIGEEGQDKLKAATVFIAGAGGLGSPIATYLALAGVGTIIIADGDCVEFSNLNRQFLHKTSSIGMLKAESARDTIISLNPDVNVITVPDWITEDNVDLMIRSSNLVIDALDSYDARFILNRAVFRLNKPMIHGAVEGLSGQMTTIIPGETPCLSCLIERAPPVRKPPIIGATAGVIGSLQAQEAVKFLTGTGSLMTGRLFIFDGANGIFEILPFYRRKRCGVCGVESNLGNF